MLSGGADRRAQRLYNLKSDFVQDTMPQSSPILEGFLEQVSWKIMNDYPETIRGMIRGRSGVYALYRGERLYYVGLATNLMGRINGHLRDRHKGLWDRFSVYLTARTEQSHIRELEALLLRIVNPKGNRVLGRLRQTRNLYPELAKTMAQRDAHRRAALLGGAVARRLRRRQAAKGKKGAAALKGIAGRRIALRGLHKGVTHRATLRVDGQVRYDGKLYGSVSAAARAAVGRHTNGWHFWRYKHNGEWRRLNQLRH